MGINDFETDLVYSLESRDDKLFEKFYHNIFPHLIKIEIVKDLHLQKRGIDKILHFADGKQLLIDEKKRRKDYGDILLEEYSNYEKKTPGWLHRNKHTDYIVYAIMPSNKVYLLPFELLWLAFKNNYTNWLKQYGRRFAKNNGYTTSNIPVPVDILLDAVKQEIKRNVTHVNN